ncbi:MAG: geranylgeranyl reductase [Sphingobacteriales bacterium BACL12 MAG-120813-bin55]|jgi:menaquinone-9 beta-reductase|nr:MAG: geranylgeranyl reductase [Sphingobacteriales bacterium BACL12 MAG-120802-bin5]KRP11458.1 MAG: geranylgeranyl reductase [Sphingobacteriales bacterium BACL12 MAG-120813-bin55]
MSQHIRIPVCIIGAGPGGAATALFLAKVGIESIIVDKASFPRDKICGDALSGKVVEVLNRYDPKLVEGLDSGKAFLPSWGVVFVAPNQESLSVPFRKDYASRNGKETAPGFIARRMDFDYFMVEEVKKRKEVKLLENTAITGFEKTPEGYRLRAAGSDLIIDTQLVIACDGAHSRFAKEEGGIQVEKDHYCAGLRVYYENVKGMHEGNFIELHFLKELLPGYFWIFPLPNGGANVGLGMRSDYVSKHKINLKEQLTTILEEYPAFRERFKDARQVDEIRGYGLPLGSKKRPISGDHFMLVGDAASLIDPFTGEGIGNAVMSGMLAAQQAAVCLQQNDFTATTMQAYDTAVYRRLWPELRLSYRMQQLVNYPWLFNFVVRKANRNKVLRETISVMFEDIDLRDRLRKPSFYFKLLFSN